jgi:hypothetical protein
MAAAVAVESTSPRAFVQTPLGYILWIAAAATMRTSPSLHQYLMLLVEEASTFVKAELDNPKVLSKPAVYSFTMRW